MRAVRWTPRLTRQRLPEFPPHLKDLLSGDLDAAVSRLRLLQGQLVAEQLQLVDQVPFVARREIALSASPAVARVVAPYVHRGSLGGFLHLGLLAGDGEEEVRTSTCGFGPESAPLRGG